MTTVLPCQECGGRCCSFPAMTSAEFAAIKSRHGLPKSARTMSIPGGVTIFTANGDCPYLKTDKRCGVYDLRPRACRLYGEISAMPCQYLYPEQAEAQMERVIGGTAKKGNTK